MPSFHIRTCSALTDYNMGRGGRNCANPPTVRAVWRFDRPGPLRILLCDDHAAELAGHERCSDVRSLADAPRPGRYNDATAEDRRR